MLFTRKGKTLTKSELDDFLTFEKNHLYFFQKYSSHYSFLCELYLIEVLFDLFTNYMEDPNFSNKSDFDILENYLGNPEGFDRNELFNISSFSEIKENPSLRSKFNVSSKKFDSVQRISAHKERHRKDLRNKYSVTSKIFYEILPDCSRDLEKVVNYLRIGSFSTNVGNVLSKNCGNLTPAKPVISKEGSYYSLDFLFFQSIFNRTILKVYFEKELFNYFYLVKGYSKRKSTSQVSELVSFIQSNLMYIKLPLKNFLPSFKNLILPENLEKLFHISEITKTREYNTLDAVYQKELLEKHFTRIFNVEGEFKTSSEKIVDSLFENLV